MVMMSLRWGRKKMDNRDKSSTEREVKRSPDGTYAKGTYPATGFHTNPERRHNGSWHKEDTPRYKIECLMKMSDDELKKVRMDENKQSFERAYANIILLMRSATDIEEAAKASKALNEMIHEVYGKMPEMQITVEADDETKEEASKIIRGFALP